MKNRDAVDAVLRDAVDAGRVPGVAAAAADRDGVLYEGASGGGDRLMAADAVCWIASMTKPLTAVAVMQLVEQGRLSLDAPARDVLPQPADAKVLDGFDAVGQPRLRAPKRPVTLRHLLTHMSGFGYDTWNADLFRYFATTALPTHATALSGKAAP